ncbi:MAG TPA: hypothetical protein VM364_00860 [Vicinamibacterales bacterium]|nr:hypothetical protein [Vicinamibacterales bacterium]
MHRGVDMAAALRQLPKFPLRLGSGFSLGRQIQGEAALGERTVEMLEVLTQPVPVLVQVFAFLRQDLHQRGHREAEIRIDPDGQFDGRLRFDARSAQEVIGR